MSASIDPVDRLWQSSAEHPAGHRLLVRHRLLDVLRARWLAPVTVVVAPAGYGKSTLLTQAIADNAAAPVGIDHFVTCWPGMTAASSLGEALCRTLRVTSVPNGRDIDEWAGAMAEAMWRLSPQQVVMMVDDVHEVAEGSEAAHLLDAVVAGLPTNGHLVFSGRRVPPVDLAQMQGDGRVVTLGDADLAFTDTEVGAFAELRGTPVATVTDCDGWPALAELLASGGGRGLGAEPDPSGAAGAYLGQEVLSELAPSTRRQLAVLAHLGPFDNDLAADALGSDVDVHGLLGGLPLVGKTGDGEWYLHALWQELLDRDTATDVADAACRAGLALLRRGRVGAGMRRLIDAQAWDDVVREVVRALGVAHPPVARDVMADWFARLPPEVRDHPGGRLIAAIVTAQGDPDTTRRGLEECMADFRAIGDTDGEVAALVQLAERAWRSDDEDGLVAAATRGFELEAAGYEAAAPLTHLARGLLFDVANDSRRTLAELDRIEPGSLNDAWMGVAHWMRASALLELGHLPEALAAAEDAVASAQFLHAPLAGTTRLQALWYQGRSAEVLDALPDLVGSISESGYNNQTVLVACQCAVVHALLGKGGSAADYLAHARAAATGITHAPLVDVNLSIAAAAVAVAAGDEPSAAATLAAYVDRHPLREGVAAAPQQRHVALFYVLVPGSRPIWDDADLGPAWEHGRALARAVVAVREGLELPADLPPLDDAPAAQAHLPPPWVAELALAAVTAQRDDGNRLLDRTWSLTRPTVTDIASRDGHLLRPEAKQALASLPVRPCRRLDLRLLGPLELHDDGGPVQQPEWRRAKSRMLLTYLVLRPTVSRQQAAADLWPRLDADAQSRNLRVTLSYLLRVLEPDREQRAPSYFVRQEGNSLSLHPGDRLTVDVWRFDAACALAEESDQQGAPAATLAHALDAVEMWRGEPDEMASEPWAVTLVEQRRLRYAALAVRAGELLLATGASARAQALAERALAVDPWSDAAHRLVVAGHHIDGNDLAAHQALRRYREAIHELGLDPDDATLMVGRLVDSLPDRDEPRPGPSRRQHSG